MSPQVEPQTSPFERFRSRTLFGWPLLAFLVVGVGGSLTIPYQRPIQRLWLGAVLYSVLLLWAHHECRRHKISIAQFFLPFPKNRSWLIVIMSGPLYLLMSSTGGLIFWLASMIRVNWGRSLWEDLVSSSSPFPDAHSPWGIADTIITLSMGPIVEELLFRGLLLRRYELKWGLNASIVVTSLLFSILHWDFLGTFAMALVLAVSYIRTHNLCIPIGLHVLQSLLVFWSHRLDHILALDRWQWYVAFAAGSIPVLIFLAKCWPTYRRRGLADG